MYNICFLINSIRVNGGHVGVCAPMNEGSLQFYKDVDNFQLVPY